MMVVMRLDVVFLIPFVDRWCRAVDEGLNHDRQVKHERPARAEEVSTSVCRGQLRQDGHGDRRRTHGKASSR